MAKAPSIQSLRKEDFPDSPEWFTTFLNNVNPFFGDVSTALGSKLDRQNLSIQTEKVRIETQKNPSDYFTSGKCQIKNKLGRPVVEVRVSQISVAGTPAYVQGLPVYPPLLDTWTNYQATDATIEGPGYVQDATGRVHLFGLVTGGTPGGTSRVFNLPDQFRPALRHVFPVISNGALGRCDVLTNGNIIAFAGSTVWFSLDGISILPWTLVATPLTPPYAVGAVPYTVCNPLAPESWVATQSGTVFINNIPGLAPNTKYDVTLTLE